MVKNLLFFGAGASLGSDTVGTPPIGEKLFNCLVQYNPNGWGKIPEQLAALFKADFEDGMTKVPANMLTVLQRAMAAYFFNFNPSLNNLYRKIAKYIKVASWNGALASLNYERLLEISLVSEELRPVVGREPNNHDEIELCLPHGCCHIFCDQIKTSAKFLSINARCVTINTSVKAICNQDEFFDHIKNDAIPPVMSYFEPRKETTAGRSFIEEQRKRFYDLVLSASTIGIVGIKIRSQDKHIWDPLTKTKARIVYCSGKEASELFSEWAGAERQGKENVDLGGYFSECFEDLCKELEINVK